MDTPNTIPDDEIDLKELILTLLHGWKIIVASTIVVALITIIYALHLPNQYTVTTKAVSLNSNSGGSQMAGLAALAGINVGSQGAEVDYMNYISDLVKNPYFLDTLISKKWVFAEVQTKKEKKAKAPLKYDTLTLAEYWGISKPDTTIPNWQYRYKMSLYGRLRSPKLGYISVSNDNGELSVKTKFSNPSLSYEVHEELLRLLRQYFKKEYKSKDQQKFEFVEARAKEVKEKLTAAENRLVRWREKNMMTTSPKVMLQGERLKRDIELQATLYKELIKQVELAKIDAKKETPAFEVIQYPELPLGPSEPNRKLLFVIGVILGGALGVFLVFLIEWIKSFKEEK